MRFLFISIIVILTIINTVTGACSSACVNQIKGQIDSQCGGPNQAICQCQNYPAIMQCFQNCNDVASTNELTSIQGWISNICFTASQIANSPQASNNGLNPNQPQGQPQPGPTPTSTFDGLFAATTIGSNLLVSASGTNIIIPFSGRPSNTNVPVAGNLYSRYNLGSISVGYRSSSYSPISSHTSHAPNRSPSPLTILISVTISLLLYLI